jgi:hypothetical protein
VSGGSKLAARLLIDRLVTGHVEILILASLKEFIECREIESQNC